MLRLPRFQPSALLTTSTFVCPIDNRLTEDGLVRCSAVFGSSGNCTSVRFASRSLLLFNARFPVRLRAPFLFLPEMHKCSRLSVSFLCVLRTERLSFTAPMYPRLFSFLLVPVAAFAVQSLIYLLRAGFC